MNAHPGRCLCGLKIAYHFTIGNRKVSCEEARLSHPRAAMKSNSLKRALLAAGAQPAMETSTSASPKDKVIGEIGGQTRMWYNHRR